MEKVYVITEHYDGEKAVTEIVIYNNLPKPFQDRIQEALANNNVSGLEYSGEEEDNKSIQHLYYEFKTPDEREKIFAKLPGNFEVAGLLSFYYFC